MSLARNLVALIEVQKTSIVADLILKRILVKMGCRFTCYFYSFCHFDEIGNDEVLRKFDEKSRQNGFGLTRFLFKMGLVCLGPVLGSGLKQIHSRVLHGR